MWSKSTRKSFKKVCDADVIFFFFKHTTSRLIIQVNMKEPKIFDVILFYNETEMLRRRISYLKSFVEKFVVINFGPLILDFQHPQVTIINDYKKKLKFFEGNFLLNLIRRKELSSIRPQDFIFISKTFEIPNKQDLSKITESQIQNIVFLIQKNIFWSTNFISDYNYVGTKVINVTSILQDKILYQTYNHHNLVLSVINKSIDSGWSLQGFQSDEDFNKHINFWGPESLRDKLTSVKEVTYYKENLLSFDYPTKISRLKIVLDSDVPQEFIDLAPNFNIRDPKDFYICLEDIKVDVPNKALYGEIDYETFCDVFKKNEVLRILKKENPFLTDQIHIKEKTESEYSVFSYLDILNSVPSNII